MEPNAQNTLNGQIISSRSISESWHQICFDRNLGLFEFSLEGTLRSVTLHSNDDLTMHVALLLSEDSMDTIQLDRSKMTPFRGSTEIDVQDVHHSENSGRVQKVGVALWT